ncbi:hypothetical protein OEZ85_006911 [Tetradesmus obliquus]|uniref:FAD/NAD(P)-binding domain-containing protein n=1 Tax=Tetradesmus obliquus TaxID=3088 RepID=A0ABY8TY71_TETOB|nr:hypothetical protein OEZ85_006911 [Tetradesmus obliquus]
MSGTSFGVRALRAAVISHSRAPAACGAAGTTVEGAARRCSAGAGCMLHRRRALHTSAAAGNGDATGTSTAPLNTSAASSSTVMDSGDGRPRVCILGGGFGGLYTAIKLELLMWPRGKKPKVTLIDQGERFIFKPLLYELINGTAQAWEVAPPFVQLLAPYPIQFVQDKVLEVQPEQLLADGGSATGGSITLASGGSIQYDWLVVSLGAAADPRGVPGVREHARPFVSLEDAEFVAQQLAAYEARAALGQPPATVAVVGAGYAGVELAAVVGERLRGKARVVLLTPGAEILEAAPAGQREAAVQALQSLGVDIMTGWKPFPVDGRGQLQTDPTLRVLRHSRVFALGDVSKGQPGNDGSSAAAAGGQGAVYPATAQVAFQQADYAAWNIWSAINGRALLQFRYQHLGDMMSLGATNAAVALPFQLPSELTASITASPLGPLLSLAGVKFGSGQQQQSAAAAGSGDGVTLEGPLAQLLRRAAYLYRQPTNEQRINVAASWMQQAADAAARLAAEASASSSSSSADARR